MSLRRLKNCLSISLSCVRVRLCLGIPIRIDGEERIMRTIFHPANFNKKNELRSNFMRPPSRPDEDDSTQKSNKLSTTRYDYAGLEFCRAHARHHQSEPNRHYWGFARFVVEGLEGICATVEGVEMSCVVKNKPANDNPAHANIEYGFWNEIGVTADSQVSEYLKKLVATAEVAKDPNPASASWVGSPYDAARFRELTYIPKK